MPNPNQHLAHAKHNLDFLHSFYSSFQFNDWSVTVAFYSSVHMVEAAIAKRGTISFRDKQINIHGSEDLFKKIPPDWLPKNNPDAEKKKSTHAARSLIVDYNFPAISAEYGLLYNNCMMARYRQYQWEKLQVEIIVKPCLKAIVSWANKELADNIKLSL